MEKQFPSAYRLVNESVENQIIFQKILAKGNNWGNGRYALVLDEINRGNLASLLGELVYLLGEEGAEITDPVRLQYSQDEFTWPKNFSLFGTMNSADVSTDKIDQAIKRRFKFEYLGPLPKLFSATTATFSFLKKFNSQHAEVDNFKKIETINELYTYFGATRTPQELLDTINDLMLSKPDEYRILQPNERLIGHSYFIKLAQRLALHGNLNEDSRQANLFFEFLLMFREELLPALVSVFNSDYNSVSKFLTEAFGYRGKLDVNKIESIEAWTEKVLFGNDQAKVTSMDEYKEMRRKKWPFAS
jgi:5-methylcytosine-specific restriction endonuclease McrBC GTP-binding regulatory subunit McrB